MVIPLAQYPDIVPPQVSVTTSYPGASAAVVEATVAQPIEAQIVGVDKMMYMKSVSGNDGSYSLTAVVRARHQPRHQHRQRQQPRAGGAVQTAVGGAPAGRDGEEAVLRAARRDRGLFAEAARYDALFICNYVTINLLDQISSTPGVGDAKLFGPQDYAMRVWLQTDRMTGLGLTAADVISAIQSAEHAGARSGASARGRSATTSSCS